MLDTGDKYEGLASERDIDKHRTSRKQLAPAFSPRALKQYEPTVHAHVDELVYKLECSPATHEGVNISPVLDPTNIFKRVQANTDVQWFERATCDLGGAIAIGQNFHNVRTGKLRL